MGIDEGRQELLPGAIDPLRLAIERTARFRAASHGGNAPIAHRDRLGAPARRVHGEDPRVEEEELVHEKGSGRPRRSRRPRMARRTR